MFGVDSLAVVQRLWRMRRVKLVHRVRRDHRRRLVCGRVVAARGDRGDFLVCGFEFKVGHVGMSLQAGVTSDPFPSLDLIFQPAAPPKK